MKELKKKRKKEERKWRILPQTALRVLWFAPPLTNQIQKAEIACMKARCMRKMEMEEGRERGGGGGGRARSLKQEKNMEKDEEMRGKESKDVEKQEGKRVSKEERMK